MVVTSYALARLDAEQAGEDAGPRGSFSTKRRTPRTQARRSRKSSARLRAELRLALTGTPVENSLRDLWSIFAFLEPGLLGSESSFRKRFEVPIAAGDARATAALHARLGPFVLRRTKEDVAPELPARTEAEIVVDLSPTSASSIAGSPKPPGARSSKIGTRSPRIGRASTSWPPSRACAKCARIPACSRKATSRIGKRSSKFDALLETVEEIIDGRHKVLVFSVFASMLRLVRSELTHREDPFAYLDGSTKDKERRSEVERFMSDDGPPGSCAR